MEVMQAGSMRGLGRRADSSIRLCHWRGSPVNFCSCWSKPVCTRCSKLDGAEISTRFFLFPNMAPGLQLLYQGTCGGRAGSGGPVAHGRLPTPARSSLSSAWSLPAPSYLEGGDSSLLQDPLRPDPWVRPSTQRSGPASAAHRPAAALLAQVTARPPRSPPHPAIDPLPLHSHLCGWLSLCLGHPPWHPTPLLLRALSAQ